MNHRAGKLRPGASGVRVLTLILMALLFVTVAVFRFLRDEKGSGSLQKKTAAGRSGFTLSGEPLWSKDPEIPGTAEADQKKLGYNLGIEDATGRGDVRVSSVKAGVDYKVSENSAVGVEVRQGIHDAQDAAAWGKSVDDETAAQAKYKLSF